MKIYDQMMTVTRSIKAMSRSKRITLLLNGALAVLLTFCICAFAYSREDFERAMWVWSYETSLASQEARTQLIDFAEEHGIDLIFLGAGHALTQHAAHYVTFIEEAHERGIRILALAGRPEWALTEHHEEVMEMVSRVLTFNASYPWAAFDGIQLDIEPYTMPGFFAEREMISEQFLDVLHKVKQTVSATDDAMELNVAIPFWYATGVSPIVVDYDGHEKPLSHHILDIVDSVSIMAYRSYAEGQIDVATADLTYASSIGKKAYIGAETNPPKGDSIPAIVTYHNEQINTMHLQLRQVEQHFRSYEGFAGIAIHHYDSYKEMVERDR